MSASAGPGELGADHGSAAGIAAFTAALLAATEVGGRSARDAYFLSELSASGLPLAIGASAVLALLSTFGLSQWLRFRPPEQVAPLSLAAVGLAFVAIAGLSSFDPAFAAGGVYLHMTGVVPVAFTAYWSLINERFDPYTAKTVIARLAAAGAFGGVVGGIIADRAVSLLSMPLFLTGLGIALVGSSWICRRIEGKGRAARMSISIDQSGLATAIGHPLLRQMALLMLLAAVVETFVDYALKVEAGAAFDDRASLVRFFAVFYTACGVLGFLIQLAIRDRFLRRFGLAAAVAMLPLSVALASSLGSLLTRLWGVVLARAAESIASIAFFRGGFQLLYTPLPPRIQRPSKPWVDVASGSAGEVAGALAVFAILLALPNAGGGVFLGLAAVGCVVALFVVRLLHRSYVGQLGESLRAGRVSLRPEEALDKTTALTIAQSQVNLDREVLLARAKAHAAGKRDPESSAPIQQATDLQPEAPTEAAPDPTPTWMEELLSGDTERVVRLLKLEVVTTPGASEAHRRKLTGYVIPLLAQEEIASTARKFLSERGSRIVGQLVDELSDPATPASIRSQLAVLLSQTGDPRAMRGVWSCAGDPDFSIRVACVRAAARIAQRDPNLRPETRERIGSELNLDESIWAQQDEAYEPMAWERSFLRPPEPVGPSLEHVFTLLAIEHGRDLMASALAGVHSEDDNLRGTALEYLESVLPAPQCQKLFDRLRESRAQTTQRSRREIEEELLLSQVGLPGRR